MSASASSLRRPGEMTGEAEGVFFSPDVMTGVFWTVVSRLVLFFAYFGVSIITVRTMDAESYGIYSLCKNIAEYLIVVCGLGLNTALIRFIPELTVSRNLTGLRNLLRKTAAAQTATVAAVAIALWLMKPYLDDWFKVDFRFYLPLTALLVGVELSRNYINDAFTALFQVRIATIMSVCRGVLWFGLTAWALPIAPKVHTALLAQILPFIVISAVGGVLLARCVQGLQWSFASFGIGRRRTMRISLSSLLDSMANMLVGKYTEVFFLGIYATPAVVGVYHLGCSFPLLVITFVPLAMQKLFTSGFAEAYAKDQDCLGRLIASLYKALILIVVPISVFGAFFSPRAIALFYGAKMQDAGFVAAAFFVIHALPTVYIPMSMAIITKEKILATFPLTILQIAVNLSLNYLLIPRYGVGGAVAAVFFSHLISGPFILYVVSRIVGGVHFPFAFFAKITASLTVLAAFLYPLSAHVNVFGLLGLCLTYAGGSLVMIKMFKLVRPEDVPDLKGLEFGRLNRVLGWLLGA